MSAPGNLSPPGPPRSRPWFQRGTDQVLDLLYPRLCFGCDVPLATPASPVASSSATLDPWLCRACQDALPVIEPPVCRVCGEPYSGALEHAFECWNCQDRDLAFDFAISAHRAEGHVRDWIHQFKYDHRHELRSLLARLLQRTLLDERLAHLDPADWLLVPVPLHPWREMTREYNQSWELCHELSRLTGIPAVNALRRVRRTASQAGLDRARRLRNLRGAFALRRPWPWENPPPLAGRRILLVDDVLTTGSTCHECARILLREGRAEKVVVITAARG